ncbi:MAG: hypothetical protein AAFU64_14200, partial [Bacteroidota bacterium]
MKKLLSLVVLILILSGQILAQSKKQARERAFQILKKYDLDGEKVYQGLTDYGNCISTSVALGLETAYNGGKIK